MFLVTGATGNVGRAVVERLAAEGRAVRAYCRHPERGAFPEGTEVVSGDMADADAAARALRGVLTVDSLYLRVSSPVIYCRYEAERWGEGAGHQLPSRVAAHGHDHREASERGAHRGGRLRSCVLV